MEYFHCVQFKSFVCCKCIFIDIEEQEVDGKTPEDNESVKDLGETADLLNLVST